MVFRYTTSSGEIVEVPEFVSPYQVLQVAPNSSRADIKEAFRRIANRGRRQERTMASLSYLLLVSVRDRFQKRSDGNNDYKYIVQEINDPFVLAAVGDTGSLLAEISTDRSLSTSTDEHHHTLLYLAARAGFYDTTEALLKMGIPVNETQVDSSTALHAASFFGQVFIVKLLLRYGADPTIKNRWDNTPVDEAASSEIQEVILSYCKGDCISQLIFSLITKRLAYMTRTIKHNGVVIAREVLRHRDAIGQQMSHTSNWINVWHGTKFEHLESIFRHGLKPSGTKLPDGSIITPPEGHIPLDTPNHDIENWANAIFLSPSIPYASDACYSEQIFSGNESWCVLIRGYAKPGSFTRHKSTLPNKYIPISGEPDTPEYRIKNSGQVVVTSIVFISLKFLKTPNLTFGTLKSLFEQ